MGRFPWVGVGGILVGDMVPGRGGRGMAGGGDGNDETDGDLRRPVMELDRWVPLTKGSLWASSILAYTG